MTIFKLDQPLNPIRGECTGRITFESGLFIKREIANIFPRLVLDGDKVDRLLVVAFRRRHSGCRVQI